MNKYVIALDFDGTLCHGNLFPRIGKPRTWMIEKAIEWRKRGHKVILWTCREDVLPTDYSPYWPVGNYLTDAIEWCKEQGLEFDAHNQNIEELVNPKAKLSRKILADVYIDDKSIIFDDSHEIMVGMNQIKFDL